MKCCLTNIFHKYAVIHCRASPAAAGEPVFEQPLSILAGDSSRTVVAGPARSCGWATAGSISLSSWLWRLQGRAVLAVSWGGNWGRFWVTKSKKKNYSKKYSKSELTQKSTQKSKITQKVLKKLLKKVNFLLKWGGRESLTFFKASAIWADAFYKSKCPSACPSVRLSVRLSVCSHLRYRWNVFLPHFPKSDVQYF